MKVENVESYIFWAGVVLAYCNIVVAALLQNYHSFIGWCSAFVVLAMIDNKTYQAACAAADGKGEKG